jgi:hypothetical protein
MSAQPDIKGLVRETQRYEFSDGLRDLQWALVMIVIGISAWLTIDQAAFWIPLSADLKARYGQAGTWILAFILVVGPWLPILATLVIMRNVRKRWLWRESGYVESKKWLVPRSVMLTAFVITIVGLAIGVVVQLNMPFESLFFLKMTLIAGGWSFGYMLLEMGRRLELERYLRVGIVGIVTTTLLIFLPLTFGQMGLLWGLIWGGLLTMSAYRPLREAIRNAGETHYV